MGFYGNITNMSRTQFQFDRVYPNRYEMEKNKLTDKIYFGHHILIDYDAVISLDKMIRVWQKEDGYHIKDDDSCTTLLKQSDVESGDIVYSANAAINSSDPKAYENCIFYKCIKESNTDKAVKLQPIIVGQDSSPYIINYCIDNSKYGVERGYDSTVWQKVYLNNSEKYVMMAEFTGLENKNTNELINHSIESKKLKDEINRLTTIIQNLQHQIDVLKATK